jgi:hypothetical protein
MAKAKPLPPIEVLREFFSYDPETGVLSRIKPSKNNPNCMGPVALVTAQGYLCCWFKSRKLQAHRVAWKLRTGEEPPQEIDHINRDKSDNRWSNLREARYSENQANRVKKKHRYLPGARRGPTGNWYASSHGKHLGSYRSEQEAHDAYVRWHRERYGEFSVFSRPSS